MTETRIWMDGGFVTGDTWRPRGENAVPAHDEIVPLAEFSDLAEDARASVRAVLVMPADDVTTIADHLGQIDLVAISFPAFSDGRAFSHAALLRDRLGYKGDIRAVGDVLIDQVSHMLRCGVSSLAVTNPVAISRLEEGRVASTQLHYQPAQDSARAEGQYSWRFRAA